MTLIASITLSQANPLDDNDLLLTTDVSDTTQQPTGTDKKLTMSVLKTYILRENNTNLNMGYNNSISTLTKVVSFGKNQIIDNVGATGVESDGSVCIGDDIIDHGARGAFVGGSIINQGISNSGLGYSVKIAPRPINSNLVPAHALALGRGAYNPFGGTAVIGNSSSGSYEVYFNNGWTHNYVDPGGGGTVNRLPASSPIVLHGYDAYDDVNATSTGDGTNINISGGDFIVMAGRPTGSGTGGKHKVQVADGVTVAANLKQAVMDVAVFALNVTSGNMMMQLADNTKALRQIKYFDDGAGHKILYF